ncbi:MAG: hypothetical protein Q8904_13990 [Bacteroidota bacterium]|nr:hypothetical protein [Bacteroidota bacterium]
MNSFETDTQISTFPSLQHLNSVLQLLPTSALIIDLKGNIHAINQQAIQFFRGTSQAVWFENATIGSLVLDLQRSLDLIEEISLKKEFTEKKILFRKFDKSVACVNLFARSFNVEPCYILIQFTDISQKTKVLLSELVRTLRQEVIALKPYLNKPGKELLEKILNKNTLEESWHDRSNLESQIEVIRKNRIASIIQLFPQLTNAEITLCGFLSLKMTIDEIACITGKTSNSLHVSFHRLLKKTSFSTGKELLRKLESMG